MAAKKINYVDNKKLFAELVKYKEAQARSLAEDKKRPRIPEYVGECILLIAQRLSYKYQFANYIFKEDMQMDGVENCLLYIDNFDPEKSQNPFAYFTQVIYYAFLRRIQGEKKHLYLKYKLQQNNDNMDNNVTFQSGDTSREMIYTGQSFLDLDKVDSFITDFESYMSRKKEPPKNILLDAIEPILEIENELKEPNDL